MAQPTLRCTEFVDTVTDWMEGALPDDAALQVEEHLAICPHCTDYVAQLRCSIEVLKETPHPAPPAAARSALLDAFRRSAS
jgi:anti-sigma factor RsiW